MNSTKQLKGFAKYCRRNTKIAISGAAAGLVVAPAGTAAPIIAPLAVTSTTQLGKGIKEAAKESDNKFWQYVGETAIDTCLGTITDGVQLVPIPSCRKFF